LSRALQIQANQVTDAADNESADTTALRARFDEFLQDLVSLSGEQAVGPFPTAAYLALQAGNSSVLSVMRDALVSSIPELLSGQDTRDLTTELFQGLLSAIDATSTEW
jgi:hypothetical protein